MSNLFEAQVLRVHHWTETLFSFTTTRDPGFRFTNGQFTLVGLEVDGRPLLRAYSMVSACYDDHLEFLSIKLPEGKLTSRLQHLKVGESVLVSKKAVGTLVLRQLQPGRNLYLLSTGTGLAPFLSVLKDPEAWEHYDRIILTHTCRHVAELAYSDFLTRELPESEFLGEWARQKFTYYPSITREPFRTQGRITQLIESGQLFSDLSLPPFDPEHDRMMLCGSPGMLTDTRRLLESRGFKHGEPGEPGHFVFEKAFAES